MTRDVKAEGKPIMVRAELTDEQWAELRIRAMRLGYPVQRIIGALIADYLTEDAATIRAAIDRLAEPKGE